MFLGREGRHYPGDEDIVKMLIEAGAVVDAKTGNEGTYVNDNVYANRLADLL